MTLSIAPIPSEQVTGRVTLERVPWRDYESLLAVVSDRALRVTYDRGRMEIEMPSVEHERLKSFVGRLVETFALQRNVDVLPVGSATWRRQAAQGGLEADECYYVQHYADVVNKTAPDLAVDPPPDLAIEIDLSASSLDKTGVYARLGVPELWRLHESRLSCLILGSDGSYRESSTSTALPDLPFELLAEALRLRSAVGEAEAIRRFAKQVQQFGPSR